MSQTIDLSDGAVEYSWPVTITEKTGKDITSATVALSLGTYQAPGDTWLTPDTDAAAGTSSRVVQLLIGGSVEPAAGAYWLWSKVVDSPETILRRHDKITIT